jgi:regulator of replication initiation timing
LKITGISGETGELVKSMIQRVESLNEQNAVLIQQNEELKQLLSDFKSSTAVQKETLWEKIKKFLRLK